MTNKLDGRRSFKVHSSFPMNVPGGRYTGLEPESAGVKAARIRFQKAGYKRLSIVLKLVETSRYDNTHRGPFYYRVTAVKKAPVEFNFDGKTVVSEYDYEISALTKKEIEQYETGNFKAIV